MQVRNSLITACAAGVALTIAAAHVQAKNVLSRREYLTFGGAVALPGVSLAPGTYLFELADPDTTGIVRVRERESHRVVFMGCTYRANRPAGSQNRRVILGEPAKGAPPPVLAWFPVDQELGYQFIYRDGR